MNPNIGLGTFEEVLTLGSICAGEGSRACGGLNGRSRRRRAPVGRLGELETRAKSEETFGLETVTFRNPMKQSGNESSPTSVTNDRQNVMTAFWVSLEAFGSHMLTRQSGMRCYC
jgi:hypothetical protein